MPVKRQQRRMGRAIVTGARPSDTITAPSSAHLRKHISASERYYHTKRSGFRILEVLKDVKLEDLRKSSAENRVNGRRPNPKERRCTSLRRLTS